MQPTLLILAAGMASRFGSMKQIEGFGPNGETIMDYSIYDAIKAGFGKVVFIIREDFSDQFKAMFEPRLQGKIRTEYVYQSLQSHVNDFKVPENRVKPWGTAHAILCAKDVIHEPFAVINADDFYGREAFEQAAAFLKTECTQQLQALVGYDLSKTLSPNGTVSRGVCEVDAAGNLVSINERTKIYEQDGRIVYEDADGQQQEVPYHSSVSMNFWCFHPSVFQFTEQLFSAFLQAQGRQEKSEFFIPIVADYFLSKPGCLIRVIPTTSQWFGVTYKEDAPGVQQQVNELVAAQVYPAALWD